MLPITGNQGHATVALKSGQLYCGPNFTAIRTLIPASIPVLAAAEEIRNGNSPRQNTPSRIPNVKPAMASTLSTTLFVSPISAAMIAITICTAPKINVTSLLILNRFAGARSLMRSSEPKSSTTVAADELSELDRDAATTPASVRPSSPGGRLWTINDANASSDFLISSIGGCSSK